jgi:phosphoserine phosphatase
LIFINTFSFCTEALQGREQNELDALHEAFYHAKVAPIIRQQGVDCINQHKAKGHHTLIMTATHEYIIRPSTAIFNVDGILATDLMRENDKITGIIAGTPCF